MAGSPTPAPPAKEASTDGPTVQPDAVPFTEQPTAIVPPTDPGTRPTMAAGPLVRPRVPPVLGPYELLEELGHGGMGIVYRARHRELDRYCAVKVLIAGEHASPTAIARFQREASAVARMGKHPNIVSVFDLGADGSLFYYAMELVPGRSLATAMEERRPTLSQAAQIVEKVARALHHAHQHGVIHRDVKPDNIVIGPDGEPQVMDFGLACEVGGGARISVTGEVMGTPAYMAPEQARGLPHATDARTDVYALGAVLYEMIAARPLRSGSSVFDVLEEVVQGEILPPRRLRPDLPPDLETVCLKCLEADPARRYATAEALAEDLARFQRGDPVLARPVPVLERTARWVRKRRNIVLPLAAAALVAGVAGAWAVVGHVRRQGAVESALQFGRRFREQGRPREARDAYREAFVLDEACQEAVDGLRWADTEVKKLDVESTEALRRAEEAQRRVEKMEAVSRVLGRWATLHRSLREMERAFYADGATPEERRARAAAGWGRVETFIAQTPPDGASQATMRACAGWAKRLAGDEEGGLEWMRRAAADDPEVPYGRLLEALVWFSEYLGEQDLPSTITNPTGVVAGDVPEDTPHMAELRKRVDELLSSIQGSPIWGRTGGEGFRAALSAMRALQGEEYDRAEACFTTAIEDPDLRCFEAPLLVARAHARYLRNDFAGALDDLEEALPARTEQVRVRFLRCRMGRGLAVQLASRGADPRDAMEAAIAEIDEVIRLSPKEGIYRLERAKAWRDFGRTEASRGLDPRASYRRAIEDANAAALLGERGVQAHSFSGLLLRTIGEATSARGEDPREHYRLSIAAFTRALGDPEFDVATFTNRGASWGLLADAERERGGDEAECLKKAISDYDQAVRLKPDHAVALNNRGLALRSLGAWEASHGGDSRPILKQAIEAFDAAIAADPAYSAAISNRGSARCDMGDAEAARRGDPTPWYTKGIEDHTKAIDQNPGDVAHRDHRAILYYKLGAYELQTGRDSRESYEHAIADEDEVIRVNAKYANAWLHRGHARGGLAAVEAIRGGDPREGLRAQIADYDRSIELTPGPLAWVARGNALLMLAQEERERGGEMGDLPERALADFDASIQRNSNYWKARLGRAHVLETLGRTDEAIQAYREVLEAVPRLREALDGLKRLEHR